MDCVNRYVKIFHYDVTYAHILDFFFAEGSIAVLIIGFILGADWHFIMFTSTSEGILYKQ